MLLQLRSGKYKIIDVILMYLALESWVPVLSQREN